MIDNKVAANGSAASESYSWQLITSNKSDEEQQNSAIKQLVIKIAAIHCSVISHHRTGQQTTVELYYGPHCIYLAL